MRISGVVIAALWLLSACAAPAAMPSPSVAPTLAPTMAPTPQITVAPTATPIAAPTHSPGPTSAPTEAPVADFALSSTAFAEGEPIPAEFTCDGADQPLPLTWTGAPAGTAEFALIFKDPDAGGFVHWVVYGIPGEATELGDPLPAGAGEGMNDFGSAGYRGPCPPARHTYLLTLYALSAPLGLSGKPAAAEVKQAAADKTLGTAQLRGTYGPRRR